MHQSIDQSIKRLINRSIDHCRLIGEPTAPATGACSAGEIRVYFLMYNRLFNIPGGEPVEVDAASAEDCAKACSTGTVRVSINRSINQSID